MASLQHDMDEMRQLLGSGSIQTAYRALLEYVSSLQAHFRREHPDYAVSGVYQGRMDFTFFAVAPAPLKQRGLKIAVVFDYEAFQFEAWLVARNRQVQRRYWEIVREADWGDCRVTPPGPGVDSILVCDLGQGFDDLDGLTAYIDRGVVGLGETVASFLAERDPV